MLHNGNKVMKLPSQTIHNLHSPVCICFTPCNWHIICHSFTQWNLVCFLHYHIIIEKPYIFNVDISFKRLTGIYITHHTHTYKWSTTYNLCVSAHIYFVTRVSLLYVVKDGCLVQVSQLGHVFHCVNATLMHRHYCIWCHTSPRHRQSLLKKRISR